MQLRMCSLIPSENRLWGSLLGTADFCDRKQFSGCICLVCHNLQHPFTTCRIQPSSPLHHGLAVPKSLFTLLSVLPMPSIPRPCLCPSCLGRMWNYKTYIQHQKLMEQPEHEQPVTGKHNHGTENNNDNFQHPSKWQRRDSSALVSARQSLNIVGIYII
jgi:hypothetical protein